MRRWQLFLAACAIFAGCASGGGKGLWVLPPTGASSLKVGQALPEVNFVDHKGVPHKLSDFIKDRPVLLVFSRKEDSDYGDYMTAIDCSARGPVSIVQVISTPQDRFPTISDVSMDPQRLRGGMDFCLVDPRGLLRRELGVGQASAFLAVDPSGVLVARGDVSDTRAVGKAMERLAQESGKKG